MPDFLISAVFEAEGNAFPTLSCLAEHDVDSIWTNVASFIEGQMAMQKGVCISGLGTFTFSQMKLDVGGKHILIQRPVFLLSERLCQSHGLKQTKAFAEGDIPVVPLNFTALSMGSPYDRDVVEGCVRETLLLLLRAVAAQRTVIFTFKGIGVLSFRHSHVKMKFYSDFISGLDGSGKLLWALNNRPGTSCSVVSDKLSSLQRPVTRNALLLPKISSEEPPREAKVHEGSDLPPMPHFREQKSGTGEDTKASPDAVERSAGFTDPSERAVKQIEVKRKEPYYTQTCRGHTRAGQELCYICMQRAQRNVPLYVSEGRQREDKEQAKILVLANQQKDEEFFQREQAIEEEKREKSKKVAAYNLATAEALRAKKLERPSQFHGSYVLRGRPATPPTLLKKRRYMQELKELEESKKQQLSQFRRNDELVDRLRQFQLADDKARRKSLELHEKKEKVRNLKKALDAQLEYRGTGIPARQPDSHGPLFGVRDGDPAALAEQKQRAHQLYQEQLSTVNNRKNEVLFKRLNEQKKERDVLQRTQKELIADRISQYERQHRLGASLRDSWSRNAEQKRKRDLEEKAFMRSGSKLLIDQCEQYRRCYQCKRNASYCGETDIFKDSRYIPGCRMIV